MRTELPPSGSNSGASREEPYTARAARVDPVRESTDAPTAPAPLTVLAAVEQDDLAPAVLNVTAALAKHRRARPTILSGFDTTDYAVPGSFGRVIAYGDALLGPEFREQRKARVHRQVCDILGYETDWPVDVEVGYAPAYIAHAADRIGADLIVMGLHRHGGFERVVGDATAREVLRRAPCSVLAVRQPLSGIPTRVMVAVDFSRASLRAARLARRIVADDGALHLVYVRGPFPPDRTCEETEGFAAVVDEGIDASFAKLVDALRVPDTMRVVTTTLDGDPVTALTRYAEQLAPDVVAIGRQRHSAVTRFLIGSVANAIVDDARWSVLVTPPGDASDPLEATPAVTSP